MVTEKGPITGNIQDPRISMVIPAFNEAGFLPTLLDTIEMGRQRYSHGPDSVEIIVADNASTDGTPEIARSRGCRVVFVAKPSIAATRNGGAQIARGEILAFIDADSQIHPETFNRIDETIGKGNVVVGASGVTLSRISPPLALMMVLALPFLKIAQVDSGVVFCRRRDWEAVGGYNEAKPVAEDIQFLQDLKRLGRKRGQYFARPNGIKAITSTRKFDKHGDWRFLLTMLCAPFLGLFNPMALDRWIRLYWYEDRGTRRTPPSQ